jgi:hypothetical protein
MEIHETPAHRMCEIRGSCSGEDADVDLLDYKTVDPQADINVSEEYTASVFRSVGICLHIHTAPLPRNNKKYSM